jgi:REP element-mobilizing transposase RayT
MSLDHVRVHYNSPQPAQLNALAYAQGSDIHLAPGQERHLPHEAWHVVQQAQGRVRPTLQMAGGVAVSDNAGLEREADVIGAQAAEVLLDAPAMERVTSAAPPTGAVVQRTIRIGTTLYTTDYARYFRRELMITLAQLDFPEKGTGAMWERVNDWLKDGKENIFADFRTLIANLYDQRLIVKRMSAGAAMGPRNLGDRPAFTTGVKKLLELSKGESQARRHVISSSTLGRAIEMVPAKLETLNAWLLRHELSAQPSTSSGMLDVRAAKIRIWEHVHNHLGNLWVGPSMPNSAIGFIRGPILRAVEGARKHMAEKDSDTVPLDSLIELLPKSPWRNELFAETWNNVRATLIDQLRAYAGSGDQVEGVAAVALMVEWIRNADLDLPSAKLDEGYFNRLSSGEGRAGRLPGPGPGPQGEPERELQEGLMESDGDVRRPQAPGGRTAADPRGRAHPGCVRRGHELPDSFPAGGVRARGGGLCRQRPADVPAVAGRGGSGGHAGPGGRCGRRADQFHAGPGAPGGQSRPGRLYAGHPKPADQDSGRCQSYLPLAERQPLLRHRSRMTHTSRRKPMARSCLIPPAIRRPMSRPLRIEFPGAIYHVTSRSDRREPIFEDDSDRAALLGVLEEGMQRFDAQVLAYCLMGNHDHFVLHTRRANLSRLMRHLNGVYTQAFNRRYRKVENLY